MFRQTQGKAAVEALDGTRITLPHATYEGPRAELDLGGRTVELRTWGTAHTRGDQIVYLPQERILFAGDLIEERSFPIFPWFPPADTEVDDAKWVAVLNGFEYFDPSVIVPGHGDLGDFQIARRLASHIEDVGQEVRKLRTAGRTTDQVITALKRLLHNYKPEQIRSRYRPIFANATLYVVWCPTGKAFSNRL